MTAITTSKRQRVEGGGFGKRGRIRTVHEAHIGDYFAEGHTAAEAKANLFDELGSILTGSYIPRVVTFDGWTAIIFRDVQPEHPWCYSLLKPETAERVTVRLYGSASHGTANEAERHARSHMAECTFRIDAPLFAIDIFDDPDDRRKYLDASWFQLAMQALMGDGIEQNEAHRIAGGMEPWPEHIAKPDRLTDPVEGS